MPVTIQPQILKYKNSQGNYETISTLAGMGVPDGGTQGQVLKKASNTDYDTEWANNITDVQVNGTSVVTSGVANIPIAGNSAGVIKKGTHFYINEDGTMGINIAQLTQVKGATSNAFFVTPGHQHESSFYGLAKAAGADMASVTGETVGTYPDAQKAAIQHMLGTDAVIADYEADTTADQVYTIGELFMLNGKLHQATATIAIGETLTVGTNCVVVNAADVFPHDVQVNGTSVVQDGVANVPVPDSNALIADAFSTSTAYAVGDYAVYSGALYRFTSDHAAGAWNSAHVTEVTVGDELADVKSATSVINDAYHTIPCESEDKYAHEGLGMVAGITFIGNDKAFSNARFADKANVAPSMSIDATKSSVAVTGGSHFVEMNGTATSSNWFTISYKDYSPSLPAGTYKFVVDIDAGDSVLGSESMSYTYTLRYEDDTDTKVTKFHRGSSTSFTMTATAAVKRIIIEGSVYNTYVYDRYKMWFGVFPGDVTITDTQHTVASDGEYEYAVSGNYDVIDTMQHKSDVANMANIKTYVDQREKQNAKIINTKKRRPLMTFIDDDACSEFADIWPAICTEKNIKVNCAVISESIGNNTHLSWEQIESMHNAGIVEFVNHTNAQETLAGIEKSVVYERVMHCKNALANHGINTGDILVYPYGAYDESCIDVLKSICVCGITTDRGSTVSYNIPPIRTFALWRNELVESSAASNPTLTWMKSVVDAAKQNNAWVIWMSHSQYAGFDSTAIANIKALIDYAVEQEVDIVTVSEALDVFANTFETGEYKNNGMANGFAIGCDGTVFGRGANFEPVHNKYLFVTPPKYFPRNNIIASYVTGYYGVGFPNDGVLISVIAPTTETEFISESYQIYKTATENTCYLYTRGFATDGLPNSFKLLTPKAGTTADRPKQVAKGYCYFDTDLGKPVFATKDAQNAWYKLTITAGTTSAGQTKFAGVKVDLEANMTKQQVRDALIDAFVSKRYTSDAGTLVYFTPDELGFTDDGVSLYLMNKYIVNYTTALYVDPVVPDTGCRGTYTRLRDGVLSDWVDATGATV